MLSYKAFNALPPSGKGITWKYVLSFYDKTVIIRRSSNKIDKIRIGTNGKSFSSNNYNEINVYYEEKGC